MRNKLIFLLPYLAGLTGINLIIFNYNIRFDQLLVVVLLLVLISNRLISSKRFYIDTPGKILILLLFSNLISSLINAPSLKNSLLQLLNLASAWFAYFIIINFLDNNEKINRFIKHIFYSSIIFISYGLLAFVLSKFGVEILGVNSDITYKLNPYIAYGIQGTMREPNIYGNYSMIFFIISFGFWLLPQHSNLSKGFIYTMILISFLGTLLSFTRGAWIGALVGILAILFYSKKLKGGSIQYVKFFVFIFAIVIFTSYYTYDFINKNYFDYKILNLVDFSEGSGAYRIRTFMLALDDIEQKPILGWGTYSFTDIYSLGYSTQGHGEWIPNFLLLSLHDTGLIGLFLTISFFIIIFKKSFKSITFFMVKDNYYALYLLIFLCSLIGIIVAFQTSSGLSLVYPWLLIGVISAINRHFSAVTANHISH